MGKSHSEKYREKVTKAKAYAAQAERPIDMHPIETRPLSSLESRIADLRIKRHRAAEFAHELRGMEARARDERERASLAARRRDVEVEGSRLEHLIYTLQTEAVG